MATFSFDEQQVPFEAGQTIAEALLAQGHSLWRHTASGQGRSIFCGMGLCGECRVIVNGTPNVYACQELAAPNLQVQTQNDLDLGGRV